VSSKHFLAGDNGINEDRPRLVGRPAGGLRLQPVARCIGKSVSKGGSKGAGEPPGNALMSRCPVEVALLLINLAVFVPSGLRASAFAQGRSRVQAAGPGRRPKAEP
jgi:hypothetical protein